jgi:hypothetical protein
LAASPACNSLLLSTLSGSSAARAAVALRVTGSLLAAGCPFPDGLAASSALLLNASSPDLLRPAAAHACGLAAFADAQVLHHPHLDPSPRSIRHPSLLLLHCRSVDA